MKLLKVTLVAIKGDELKQQVWPAVLPRPEQGLREMEVRLAEATDKEKGIFFVHCALLSRKWI